MAALNFEKLYFLGPEGTYAQKAMDTLIKTYNISAQEIVSKNPITAILKLIDNENNSAAVLPIENSIEGIVRETIDNLVILNNDEIKITAETVIPINHCLVSTSDNINDIQIIISHPQALDQCSGYINKNFSNIKVISSPSTAEAAKSLLSKGKEYAAISSEIAAEKFGLNILDKNINDIKDNKTRFLLISKHTVETSNNYKTSLFFSVKNQPGSLYNILKIFYKYQINMLYIESRPSKKLMGEYNFCIDIEGHQSDKDISDALYQLKEETNSLKITGSYPRFQL